MSGFRLLSLALLGLISVSALAQDQKTKPNDEKHTFRLETDSGRYGVASDKLDPKLLGVDIFPGAKIEQESNNDGKGASLSFDWGHDSARLYVQKYVTTDSPDKVIAFYRKQLSKYGVVLVCSEGKPISAGPSELKCEENKDHTGTELKVGTEQKQHIVGVNTKDGRTEFGIVYLEKTKRGDI